MAVRVVLEVAPKKAFASALDWPGWSRSGKSAEVALENLIAYGPRYARVAKRARVAFSPPATVRGLTVVERLAGAGATEFGVPGVPAAAEGDPLSGRDLQRLLALLRAAWATFDAVAEAARGSTLRLGPRGGGRQVPKMTDHVRDADGGYLHQLGAKAPRGAGQAALRKAILDAITARATGQPLADPNRVRKPWSPRYAARRSAWHALDHAWEIEDRLES